MSWSAPKTDWDTDDGIGMADLNRIEANTEYLASQKGLDIASAESLDVTERYHVVTGTTAIKFISTDGWNAGDRITLTFDGQLDIWNNDGTPGAGYAKIYIGGLGVFSYYGIRTGMLKPTFDFIYDGTYWRMVNEPLTFAVAV